MHTRAPMRPWGRWESRSEKASSANDAVADISARHADGDGEQEHGGDHAAMPPRSTASCLEGESVDQCVWHARHRQRLERMAAPSWIRGSAYVGHERTKWPTSSTVVGQVEHVHCARGTSLRFTVVSTASFDAPKRRRNRWRCPDVVAGGLGGSAYGASWAEYHWE